MKKRLWSILLTACLLMGLLPTVALAEDPATQTQTADFTASDNGVAALALLNAAKTTGAEDSTWENNTLTLKGVNFNIRDHLRRNSSRRGRQGDNDSSE